VNLLLVGLNHRSAPVAVREQYAVAPSELSGLDEKLVRSSGIDEAALLSTCNRTEVLAVSRSPETALERLLVFLRHELGDGSAGPSQVYELHDTDAVGHLFRVASSLDSMVLGEAQILGQVKQAYRGALEAGSLGPVLNRLFQSAFRAAKRVRSETGLGASSLSVGRIGVQLACELFESLAGKKVLLLGAGVMAESALRGLQEAGVERIVVVSRTLESAERLAGRFSGRPASLDSLADELSDASVVLSSVQVDRPLLGRAQLDVPMRARQGRPLLIVDLGVPRNVDPRVNELENVYLYDMDDLEGIVARGRAQRGAELQAALGILTQEQDRFEAWRTRLPLVPTIRELVRHANELARVEARRASTRPELAATVSPETLERLAEGIVAKLLHRPLEQLRKEAEWQGGLYYADAVRRLFGLELEDDSE